MTSGTVLIVEDDERNRKLVRDVLQFHGFQTAEAPTAERGLELARTVNPCVILMDIRLPGMDGEAALARLRADPSTAAIPVVAVTSSTMRGDEQHFLSAGFNGYIPKPLDIMALPAAVGRYCGGCTEG